MDLPSSSPLSDYSVPLKGDDEEPGPSPTDVVAHPFLAFDHGTAIIQPFDGEAKRDDEFQQKLSTMILELMLEFHAWSSARPIREAERAADTLEKEINGIIETEKEQGTSSTPELLSLLVEKTRQKLNDFVVRIKLALAALTGLASG